MPQNPELKVIVQRMIDAGEPEENIATVIQHYNAPESQPSALSRFASGVTNALVAPIESAAQAVRHPIDTYNGLVDQSAKNFEEAQRILNEEHPDYGHALAHGIAAVLPPFGVVTDAADKIRSGDYAGAAGEAVGTGLVPAVYGGGVRLVKKSGPVIRVAGNAANRAVGAATDALERNPALSTGVGAAVGYAHSGVPGAIEGALGGGAFGRLLRMAEQLRPAATATADAAEAAPRSSRPIGDVNSQLGQALLQQELGGSAPPAESVTPQAPAAPAASVPASPTPAMRITKADRARITALDRERGATDTARALRHDPRFANLSPVERVAAIRAISDEPPQTLPATARAAYDRIWATLDTPAAKLDAIRGAQSAIGRAYLQSLFDRESRQ
jgi:hypothetical protein